MKYNHAISLTDTWHSGPYPSHNRDSLQLCHRQSQYILLPPGTKHQLSLLDKIPMVHRVFHTCLIFQFRSCTVTEGRLEKKTTNTEHLICHNGELITIYLPRINSLQHWPMSLPSQPSINFWSSFAFSRAICLLARPCIRTPASLKLKNNITFN